MFLFVFISSISQKIDTCSAWSDFDQSDGDWDLDWSTGFAIPVETELKIFGGFFTPFCDKTVYRNELGVSM